jgi:U3 small nucleolar RNA-associated protein 11
MSSFRNAVKRKTHKERSQPESRKRFGLLEKHKDYVERARDYNRKKKRIQALQEKAAFRNPDEFYMKMQNMATKRGVHQNVGEDSIDADTLKLFKTQDLGYITLKKQSEQTKIERLKSSLHCVSALAAAPKQNSHTIFVDSDEDLDEFEPSEHFATVPDLVGRTHNRLRREQLEADMPPEPTKKIRKKSDKAKESQYRELAERIERQGKLDTAASLLHTERLLQGKGKRRKVSDAKDGKPAQYVWKQERKR